MAGRKGLKVEMRAGQMGGQETLSEKLKVVMSAEKMDLKDWRKVLLKAE